VKIIIRIILVLVGLVIFVALFYAEEDWRGWHDWQKFKWEEKIKGEKYDFSRIVPAAVPDDQNFALTPIVFTSYGEMLTRDGKLIPYAQRDTNFVNRMKITADFGDFSPSPGSFGNWQKAHNTDLSEWATYYRTLAATTNVFPVSRLSQTPAQVVLMALSKYDSVIEELRQASQLPFSRFPVNYDDENPAGILLPHLAALKGCAQVLQLRASAEMQSNQSEKAAEDIKLELRLIDSIRNEPFLISHLVRMAILNIELQPIYEGLEQHKWSDAQLVMFDSELSKLDFLADYKFAMHGEMGFQIGIAQYLRYNSGQYLNLVGDASDYGNMSPAEFMIATAMHFHLVPSGWFYQNQLHCARAMEEYYLPVTDVDQQTFTPALILQAKAAIDKEREHLTLFNILESYLLPGLGGAAQKFAKAQSSTDLARTAIALERSYLIHGKYPDALDSFLPPVSGKVPHDIIGGQPLHYRRTDDGQFTLYSVGWNETDDGGVVVMTKGTPPRVDPNNGDWVWRYPENKVAEIFGDYNKASQN
jgi:hypothetical protein